MCLIDEYIVPGWCSVSPRPLVAVTPLGHTPDFGAGAIVKIKKRNQKNVAAVLLQEAHELCKLRVATAFIVVDRAESNFTQSSHDTQGELCQSLSENRPTPSGTDLLWKQQQTSSISLQSLLFRKVTGGRLGFC